MNSWVKLYEKHYKQSSHINMYLLRLNWKTPPPQWELCSSGKGGSSGEQFPVVQVAVFELHPGSVFTPVVCPWRARPCRRWFERRLWQLRLPRLPGPGGRHHTGEQWTGGCVTGDTGDWLITTMIYLLTRPLGGALNHLLSGRFIYTFLFHENSSIRVFIWLAEMINSYYSL